MTTAPANRLLGPFPHRPEKEVPCNIEILWLLWLWFWSVLFLCIYSMSRDTLSGKSWLFPGEEPKGLRFGMLLLSTLEMNLLLRRKGSSVRGSRPNLVLYYRVVNPWGSQKPKVFLPILGLEESTFQRRLMPSPYTCPPLKWGEGHAFYYGVASRR